jgi:hypothetical protein
VLFLTVFIFQPQTLPCHLTLLQRNDNGIVDDIIRSLHKLASRRFRPEIVRALDLQHRAPLTLLQVFAAVESKPFFNFWQEAAGRLLGSADAPLTLIRDHRPQGSSHLASCP